MTKDNVTRIGATTKKQAGGALRKHDLRSRAQEQLDRTLTELEMYKAAHHNLSCMLEGLVRIHGPLEIPIELLELHCRYGNVEIGADQARGMLTVRLKAPQEAPYVPPAPEDLPPMPEGAPRASALVAQLHDGQVVRDGKVVQEHAGYRAEVFDHLEDVT
jgi:hypothetical protein